jgi:YidC/Oxa1 family membrane protein insertase
MFFVDALIATATQVSFYIVLRILFSRFLKQEPFSFFKLSDLGATLGFGVIVFMINYYLIESTPKKENSVTEQRVTLSGQSFVAPELAAVQKPLETEINFLDSNRTEKLSESLATNLARYVLSDNGAVIEEANLFWQKGEKLVPVIGTCLSSCAIGLSERTPIDFELVSSEKNSDGTAHVIKYVAKMGHGSIYKTFIFYMDSYRVDVKFLVEGKDLQDQVARLFITSPIMTDDLKGIVNKPLTGSSVKIQDIVLSKEQTFKDFWFEPKFFGFNSKFLTTICFDHQNGAISRAYFKKINEIQYQAILESKPLISGKEISWSLYIGPKTLEGLASVSEDLTQLMQYGWLGFIAKPMMKFLVYLQEKTGNYGIAIILLTLLLKLILLPFTLRGERSMKKQAEFEKKRQYLQQKFRDDRQGYEQAMAELINKQGVPMLSGCLPMLLNIPVFIALNKILSSAIELHGAQFAWLPDLSAQDPYYILSILVFCGMAFSGNVAVSDPRQWASRFGFALVIGAVTAYLASGLSLFIAVNTLATVVQSWMVRLLDK